MQTTIFCKGFNSGSLTENKCNEIEINLPPTCLSLKLHEMLFTYDSLYMYDLVAYILFCSVWIKVWSRISANHVVNTERNEEKYLSVQGHML